MQMKEALAAFNGLGDDDGVAIYHRGRSVLEAYSGGVTPTSLLLVASSTKFVESACIAVLVDRGWLRYDDLIAAHWPGFARGDAATRRRES